jgi:hypothetical protein
MRCKSALILYIVRLFYVPRALAAAAAAARELPVDMVVGSKRQSCAAVPQPSTCRVKSWRNSRFLRESTRQVNSTNRLPRPRAAIERAATRPSSLLLTILRSLDAIRRVSRVSMAEDIILVLYLHSYHRFVDYLR